MSRTIALLAGLVLGLSLALPSPALSQSSQAVRDEIVFEGKGIIETTINGVPLRFEIEPGFTGPAVLNPAVAERLALEGGPNLRWDFGGVEVQGYTTRAIMDLGSGEEETRVAWSDLEVSPIADGVMGVHGLPYRNITFRLREPSGPERVQTFKLKRKGRRSYPRLGTEVKIGKRRLFALFTLDHERSFVSAPTANFIATHHDGAFVPDSDGIVTMRFGIERPTRDMRLSFPIEIGELAIDRFAVRIEDYGKADKVGEMDKNDPRFTPGSIVVSGRKGAGKPDIVTRIGSEEIAHCSKLTYDLEAMEVQLTCGNDRIEVQ